MIATTAPQTVVQAHFETTNQACIDALATLPEQLSLTPVKDKAAKRDNWQIEPSIPRDELTILLEHGERVRAKNGGWYQRKYTGYGLRTGSVSGGILALDVDGPLADAKLTEISGGNIPYTPSWTSGKPSCRQLAFQLSETTQAVLEAVDFTRRFIDCGEGQQLDFRYNGCQSVLPPSQHPETGQYRWIVSFADCSIAPAPEWLELKLIEWALEQEVIKPKAKSTPKPILKGDREPLQDNTVQLWGNKTAPGRIASNEGLMTRWNDLRITGEGKGKSNEVLLRFNRLLKESGIDCETAISEFKHFAPQIPGYHQYASKDTKRDVERSTRAKRIVVNWYRKDGYSGHLAKRDTDHNQREHDAAIKRITEAVTAGIEKGIETVRGWIEWIQDYCFRKFGIRPHRNTLFKKQNLKFWHPKHKENTPPTHTQSRTTVRGENILIQQGFEGVHIPPQPKQPSPKLSLWFYSALATATAPKPKQEKPEKRDCNVTVMFCSVTADSKPQKPAIEPSETVTLCSAATFRKGDRVILDDDTGASYCGKECTITAVLPNGCYRLDMTYTGKRLRPRQTKNAFEAFPSFLRHASSPVTPRDNANVPPDNHGTTEGQPAEVWVSAADIQRLKIPGSHWLYAICGGAKQRIRPDEVEQGIWQQLLSLGGAVNA